MKIVIAGLLLSNILTAVLLCTGYSRKETHGGPRELIIRRLGFDEHQIRAYDEEIKKHRQAIKSTDRQIRETKNKLYELLTDQQPQPTALMDSLATLQRKIETIHFDHFMKIKKICGPGQLDAYNKLTKEIARLFGPPPPPKDEE